MTKYILEYFQCRGRGEGIRYLLNDNGIDYEEIDCYPDEETWMTKFKPRTPFGQTPFLRQGDFEMAQSNSILRYLGRKHGLIGDTPEEAALGDMINDHVETIRSAYVTLIYENYDAEKANYIKALPDKLRPVENLLTKWGKTYILDKITFVDYNLFDLLDIHLTLSPDCLKDFPRLQQYYQRILERPGIKAYRESAEFKKRPINFNDKQ